MTSRELTSGFDFWSLRHMRMAVMHLPVKFGTRVASKAGNLPSKFGHARPLGSRIIRYVRDERTDGQTKATLIVRPFPTVLGIMKIKD